MGVDDGIVGLCGRLQLSQLLRRHRFGYLARVQKEGETEGAPSLASGRLTAGMHHHHVFRQGSVRQHQRERRVPRSLFPPTRHSLCMRDLLASHSHTLQGVYSVRSAQRQRHSLSLSSPQTRTAHCMSPCFGQDAKGSRTGTFWNKRGLMSGPQNLRTPGRPDQGAGQLPRP